jgi:hypothetical protein
MLKSNCNKYDLYQRKTQIGINDKTLFFAHLKHTLTNIMF